MNLKKIGKVLTSKSVGTGSSSYEKRIYRAGVSQRLRETLVYATSTFKSYTFALFSLTGFSLNPLDDKTRISMHRLVVTNLLHLTFDVLQVSHAGFFGGSIVRTRSLWAFFFEFQQNSNIATRIARARPQSSTTNTPPATRVEKKKSPRV